MIDVGFVFFRTLDLNHLDAAWYTLSKQNFTNIKQVIFIDNNTIFSEQEISDVLDRYPIPVPTQRAFAKHGDVTKTHSWSVNLFIKLSQTDWVMFCRADYLMDYDLFTRFIQVKDQRQSINPMWHGLITSHCHQMGYDAQLSNTDALAPYSLPGAPWRYQLEGPRSLMGKVPAHMFESSGVDAGVWLTMRENFISIGGMNERMVNWGFNQQEAQRLMMGHGVEMVAINDYLYHHQHHYAERNFNVASEEMRHSRG